MNVLRKLNKSTEEFGTQLAEITYVLLISRRRHERSHSSDNGNRCILRRFHSRGRLTRTDVVTAPAQDSLGYTYSVTVVGTNGNADASGGAVGSGNSVAHVCARGDLRNHRPNGGNVLGGPSLSANDICNATRRTGGNTRANPSEQARHLIVAGGLHWDGWIEASGAVDGGENTRYGWEWMEVDGGWSPSQYHVQ